jgi:hypothetical protein
MARETNDPDQREHSSYFAENPDAPLPEPKTVVVEDDPGGVGPGRIKGDDENPREGVRRGDKKPVRERAPPNPPQETPLARPEDGLEELERQLNREREARERAEQAALQAMQRAQVADQRYGQAASGMIDSAIEAAARQSDQAEAAFAAAMDIGDHKIAAKAQTAIADARANLLRLQEQKQMIAEEAERAKRAPPPRLEPATADNAADQNLRNITGQLEKTGYRKSADWLRQHPDMVRDREAINRIDGAHGYVVNVLKIPVESDRYFDEMEAILLGDRQDDMEARRVEPRSEARREARPAAPVSRSAPSLRTGQTRRTIHLTPEQRQHARDVLGMTDEEYAESLADAEDRGKLLRMKR